MIGHWRNFDELEENLSLAELEAILDAERKRQHGINKFNASLKGIDLDAAAKSDKEDPFERAKAKAEARARGMTEEQYEFDDMGLGFEDEDEYEEEDYFEEED